MGKGPAPLTPVVGGSLGVLPLVPGAQLQARVRWCGCCLREGRHVHLLPTPRTFGGGLADSGPVPERWKAGTRGGYPTRWAVLYVGDSS